jgi:hypothetical protein
MINLQTDGPVCRPPSPDDSFSSRLQNGQTIDYLGGISGSATIFDATTGNKTATEFNVSQIPSPSNMTANYNLNGGFSLHSIPWTLNCIKQYKSRPWIRRYSEDKLWNFCRSQEAWNVTELDAYAFASNREPPNAFKIPMALKGNEESVHLESTNHGHGRTKAWEATKNLNIIALASDYWNVTKQSLSTRKYVLWWEWRRPRRYHAYVVGAVREIDHVTDPEINRVIRLEIDRGTGLVSEGIDSQSISFQEPF